MSSKHFFVCGHTAKGFCNLIRTNIQPLNKLYILKDGPDIGRSVILDKIGKALEELLYDIEYVHCPFSPDSLDAVLIPTLGIGIIDGMPPHMIDPTVLETNVELISLGIACDNDSISAHTKEIQDYQDGMQSCFEKAYDAFAKGLGVHDEWEKIYISNMNFSKANQLTEEVIHNLLGTTHFNRTSCIKHRFFGGSTPYGPMDFVENITQDIASRYFIKGRPGSGKSTMLKKILESAGYRGIDTEVYHCGFDADSLDMLLFPELNLCIFDSTSPHEYYPSRQGDHVIDMYAELITPNTDETYESQLADIIARYKLCTKEGTTHLAAAKSYHNKIEKYYIDATNFEVLDQIYEELYQKIIK